MHQGCYRRQISAGLNRNLIRLISNISHILHIRLSDAGIRHCPFHYNILNDIKDHCTSSRNKNRGNRGNIKSRQRDLSRLRLCFLQPDLSPTEWVTPPGRVSAHAPQLSLSPSHHFLSDLMENTTGSKSLLGYYWSQVKKGTTRRSCGRLRGRHGVDKKVLLVKNSRLVAMLSEMLHPTL